MRSRAVVVCSAACVVGLSTLGCARNAEEKQLDAMRADMDGVHDGSGRLGSPMNPRDDHTGGLVVPEGYSTDEGPPRRSPPPVVQLGANGPNAEDDEGADPQDTTPRPTIRVSGGGTRVGRGARGDDTIEEYVPDDPSGTPARPAPPAVHPAGPADPDAKRAYDAAIALVNARRYDDALDALARFLVKWPDHPYADNAMYWRGECYYARGDYARAADQFEGVLARFPSGDKVPDALLRLGMAHQKLGNAAKAKECFDRLAVQYPDSDAAHHIPSNRISTEAPSGAAAEEHR